MHLDILSAQFIVVMKGAPEIIFARCLTVATDTIDINLTNDMKKAADIAIENLANTGEYLSISICFHIDFCINKYASY